MVTKISKTRRNRYIVLLQPTMNQILKKYVKSICIQKEVKLNQLTKLALVYRIPGKPHDASNKKISLFLTATQETITSKHFIICHLFFLKGAVYAVK